MRLRGVVRLEGLDGLLSLGRVGEDERERASFGVEDGPDDLLANSGRTARGPSAAGASRTSSSRSSRSRKPPPKSCAAASHQLGPAADGCRDLGRVGRAEGEGPGGRSTREPAVPVSPGAGQPQGVAAGVRGRAEPDPGAVGRGIGRAGRSRRWSSAGRRSRSPNAAPSGPRSRRSAPRSRSGRARAGRRGRRARCRRPARRASGARRRVSGSAGPGRDGGPRRGRPRRAAVPRRPVRHGPGPSSTSSARARSRRSSRGRSTPCAETARVRSRSAVARESRDVPERPPSQRARRRPTPGPPRGSGARRLRLPGSPARLSRQVPRPSGRLEGEHRRDAVLASVGGVARADHPRQAPARHPSAGDVPGREPDDDRPGLLDLRRSGRTPAPCAARATSALPAHFVSASSSSASISSAAEGVASDGPVDASDAGLGSRGRRSRRRGCAGRSRRRAGAGATALGAWRARPWRRRPPVGAGRRRARGLRDGSFSRSLRARRTRPLLARAASASSSKAASAVRSRGQERTCAIHSASLLGVSAATSAPAATHRSAICRS